jgi:type I restriction enzyme, S subunit
MSKTKHTQPTVHKTGTDLPEGWASTIMGDVAEVIGGGTPKSTDPNNFADDGHPWVTPADLSDFDGVWIKRGRRGLSDQGLAGSSARLVPPGTVLMSSRAPIGYVAVAANELCTNQGFKSFVLAQGLDPQFVFYWLRFKRAEIEQMGSGSTFMEVSGTRCREIPIIFPPLREQKRIVAKVEELLERVNAARARLAKVPAVLKSFRQSVLSAAFSGQLTETWREKNRSTESAITLIKEERFQIFVPEGGLPELPEGWIWAALGNYGGCSRGKFSVRPRNDPAYFGGSHPFIQIGDLPQEGGWIKSHKQTLNDKGLSISKMFPRGTAAIAIVGATIGNTGLLGYDMCFPDSMVGIETETEAGNRYVELYLRHKKREIRDASYSSGGQPNIKLEVLNPYPLALPPLKEQIEIVRRIEALFNMADGIAGHTRAAMVRAERLTQAILSRAFRGELVPTEAELATKEGRDYEQASVRLEWIQEARKQHKLAKCEREGKNMATRSIAGSQHGITDNSMRSFGNKASH